MPIQETTFTPKRYLTLKKSISTSQISDKQMYDEAGKKLHTYLQKNNLSISGPWSVLYFSWDEVNKKTDIGIAFPVDGLTTVNDPELSIVDVPESKAAMDVLHGSYEGLGKIHHLLMNYAIKNGYDMSSVPVLAIEEYTVGPMSELSPENWETNIYYLHN